MYKIKLDLEHSSVSVDSATIEVDTKSMLAGSIAKLCSPPIRTDKGWSRYHLLGKSSVFGKSADCVIEVGEGRVCTITLLFDFIEFLESSILESKILKAFEKSFNVRFISNHPSTAFLDFCDWGQATFLYDAKQGDLSLEITFQLSSNEPNLKA